VRIVESKKRWNRFARSIGSSWFPVIAGGPAPLIAAALFAHYHSSYAIAAYVLFCAILSLTSTAMLGDCFGQGHLAGASLVARRTLSEITLVLQ
jgi:hypothetical protein